MPQLVAGIYRIQHTTERRPELSESRMCATAVSPSDPVRAKPRGWPSGSDKNQEWKVLPSYLAEPGVVTIQRAHIDEEKFWHAEPPCESITLSSELCRFKLEFFKEENNVSFCFIFPTDFRPDKLGVQWLVGTETILEQDTLMTLEYPDVPDCDRPVWAFIPVETWN